MYHYKTEKRIKDFCKGLYEAGRPQQGIMHWHPETNEAHATALNALKEVAGQLGKMYQEACLKHPKHPEAIKKAAVEAMDPYLVRASSQVCENPPSDKPAHRTVSSKM